MDPVVLARIQFAFTIGFHYIFPPLSIGLGVVLVITEGMYLRTGKDLYLRMTKFWAKVFALTFAMGVATGIVMEFQFGTNWSTYSRFVGDVFGSALAAEGIFAFFLESGFLAVVLFGWDRVKPGVHYLATVLVSLGSMFSAVWIIVANSWMQTPAGFHIVGEGDQARAEITNFAELVFNPSSMDRLFHTVMGAWLSGAFLVLSVSAYYILKRKHDDFARASMKIGLVLALVASLLQLFSGHRSAVIVSRHQPAKLAAMEGIYPEFEPAAVHVFGWVDEQSETVRGPRIPGLLSWLVHGDASEPVTGLHALPSNERPPVQVTFQAFHGMVAIGMGLILLSLLGVFFWVRGTLFKQRWLMRLFVISVLGPQIANQLGWAVAEVGRQPWIVYGLLRTSQGVSKVVDKTKIIASLGMFGFIYALLFVLFIFLLDQKIRQGPDGSNPHDPNLAMGGRAK